MLLNLHMEMVDLVLEAILLDLDVEVPTLEVLLVELCLTMVLLQPQLAVRSPVKNVPMCQDNSATMSPDNSARMCPDNSARMCQDNSARMSQDKNARMSQDRCPGKNVPMCPDKSAELCLDNSA